VTAPCKNNKKEILSNSGKSSYRIFIPVRQLANYLELVLSFWRISESALSFWT
jgi:hypothetical protein